MSIFGYMLLGGILLFVLFLAILVWQIRSGQMDDLGTPAERALWDDPQAPRPRLDAPSPPTAAADAATPPSSSAPAAPTRSPPAAAGNADPSAPEPPHIDGARINGKKRPE